MKLNYIFLLIIALSCNVIQKAEVSTMDNEQRSSIVPCDTSNVSFYEDSAHDTIVGKGVMRIEIKIKNDEVEIIEEKVIMLVLKSENGDRLLDYRSMVTDSLDKEETFLLTFYGEKMKEVYKERGLCVMGEFQELDSKFFDFPFVFKVYPFSEQGK